MKPPPRDKWDRETALVAQIAACASFVSFVFYSQHNYLLLYGDAVAHINIARRVFDSLTPGLLQLGTVWLPLPHLLMLPFLLSDSLWQSGIGGSLPSLAAYVLATAGMFRLGRQTLSLYAEPNFAARAAAWSAAVIYGANPNLLYLQTTAMTEPLYLAFFVWSVVYFSEFAHAAESDAESARASLLRCGGCLLGACLTRYDGWFLAAALCLAALVTGWKHGELRRSVAKFVVVAVLAPALWLAYNAVIYRNPLEFANGPYSARAIEQKSIAEGVAPHPGSHNFTVAASYFLKSAEFNVAEGKWQVIWVALLLLGPTIILFTNRRLWPLLLLAVPLPFYVLSVARGNTPIYVPGWWPFSYYNTRYGIELLPAMAVCAALAMHLLLRFAQNRATKTAVTLGVLILVAGSYASVRRAQPICFREAWTNSSARIALETEVATNIRKLPHDARLLMYLGDHVGALQQAGFPLRQVINEGNHRPWKEPADPDGLWEHALADPARFVDLVVAFDGDPVAQHVEKRDLTSMIVVRTVGQPAVTIYATRRWQR